MSGAIQTSHEPVTAALPSAYTPAKVCIQGERMHVQFDRFDLPTYEMFLRCKRLPEYELAYTWETDSYTVTAPARFASIIGVTADAIERGELPFADYLFDYQQFIVSIALQAKRYAVWADCGLGKTAMFYEWARHVVHRTAGRVLIMSPLQIIGQTVEEAARWYGDSLPIVWLHTREQLAAWCADGTATDGATHSPGIAICNYEKMIAGKLNELRYLSGLVLDESSILKTGGGVIKWNLIHSAKGIEYKLSCTATPAPNDSMEYASQAAFLEKLRNEGEILWTWYQRDKYGNWSIKKHGLADFYRFMAGWSIYLRSPGAYGFKDNVTPLPEPVIREYSIEATQQQLELAFAYKVAAGGDMVGEERMGVTTRTKLNQLAKGFVYSNRGTSGGPDCRKTNTGKTSVQRVESRKPAFTADIIRTDARDGLQVLVWTVYDEESNILAEQLADCGFTVEVLQGSVKPEARQPIIERFRHGDTRVLISKASLLGYGLNFQNCGSMVFSGWNDSYEQWYQAVRRAYRYGQTKSVRIHVP